MHKPQEQVRDFHRACDLARPDTPTVDWQDQATLRFDLIKEEAEEFLSACEEEDMLAAIDALCDLLYVTYGAGVAMGVDLEPFYDEVQRANMEKTAGPKREDGKQLKPDGWRGPDHRKVWTQVYGDRNYRQTFPPPAGIRSV